MQHWKYALRAAVRRPGFSLAVFALLTLGIAANTALFSVVDTVLLRPLPYPQPDRLVTLYESSSARSEKTSLIAPPRIEDWNRLNHTFAAISGVYTENVTDTSGAEPERLSGVRVAPRYFAVFDMPPQIGRVFTAQEEMTGGPLAAVISYRLWARRYGQDTSVLQRRLLIGGKGYTIVGVMPKSFTGAALDVWIPAQTSQFLMGQRDARFYSGVGRMQPGVTAERARADLNAIQQGLGEQFPKTDAGWSAQVQDLKEARVGDSGTALLLLFGAVGLLLFITVTNVASLVLAQFHRRERQLAIRASIGATRAQVVGALLRELVLIATAGALGGWAAAVSAMPLLAQLFHNVPRITELQVDWRALTFAIAVSVLGVVGFGLLPALRATQARYAASLIRSGRGIAGRRQSLQRVLVAGQIALTMLLLSSAGLLLRSFYQLSHVDLGCNPSKVLLFHVAAAWDEDRDRIGRMQETLIAELNRLPGVQAAGITNFLPASGATLRYQFTLEGAGGAGEAGTIPAGSRTVSPGYLKAIQAPLIAGGWCPELRAANQKESTAPTAMVNRRFVDVYARGENLIGRHIAMAQFRNFTPREIVGVIGDIKEDGLSTPAYPYIYYCAGGGNWPDPEYAVRTAGDPRLLMNAIRQLVRNVDSSRAIFGVQLLDDALDAAIERPRSDAGLLLLFALAAMLLAAVGLYSLVSQIVGARRQEIGVRMALGARPRQIVGTLVISAARLIGAGMLVGLALTVAAQRVLHTVLFGVGPLDALSIGAAALLLSFVSTCAAFVPARTAAAIDPIESMRSD